MCQVSFTLSTSDAVFLQVSFVGLFPQQKQITLALRILYNLNICF
jgi:hypothetical protein